LRCVAKSPKSAHAHWVVGKWEPFRNDNALSKWFSFTNHPNAHVRIFACSLFVEQFLEHHLPATSSVWHRATFLHCYDVMEFRPEFWCSRNCSSTMRAFPGTSGDNGTRDVVARWREIVCTWCTWSLYAKLSSVFVRRLSFQWCCEGRG
jgi:hypothetical protein